IALVWIFTPKWGVKGAALAWIPSVAVAQVMSGTFLKEVLPRPFEGLPRTLVPVVLVSAIAAGIAMSIAGALPSFAGLVLAATVSSSVVVVSLALLDRGLELGLADDLRQAFPQVTRLLGMRRISIHETGEDT
ncbi:MAG: polysaccharide biosynthesis C-terminal domain-containing protein, partial [Rhodothermales bacterium]|nr:polysaccharide biosynthesis C-terminal domain-containing protein [Rhodothermales bacterium]